MDKLSKNWQRAIITLAEAKLGRSLSLQERAFVVSRQGCLALEAIEDTVQDLNGEKLEEYLNSEYSRPAHE